jgi:alpha-D-ribose 1-methylphosphonate 5-triphosphate synthase subunit PhnH
MSDLGAGLVDPAHDSQRFFRAMLEAYAHPGRILPLLEPPQAAGPLSRAATAILLTLVDRDTPLWLAPSLATSGACEALRFHTGAPLVADKAKAAFAVVPADGASLDGFTVGTDRYPDRSATLIVEVPSLRDGPTTVWRGPGIADRVTVAAVGLPDRFWSEWAANRALLPCGVDIVFTAGGELLALPRSIAVES